MSRVSGASAQAGSVPLLDLQTQYAAIRTEIETAIRAVCESQRFVMGPEVEALEREIAAYTSTAHAIGVSSGTDALLVALMALEIGPGDAVLTTPFSFFATAGVVTRLGATPIFCDIDPETYNLDPDAVLGCIRAGCHIVDGRLIHKASGDQVKALMPVHLFGQTADMKRLMAIAEDNDLRVVEDAAQAIGSEEPDGRRAGSIGDIGCFSFFPSKNLGAFGDGGMCVTHDEGLAERLRVLRVHGANPKYYHSFVGGNFRLDALQAAVLRVKLRHLDRWTSGRQANAVAYDDLLKPVASQLKTPHVREGARHIFNQYTIRVQDREGLRRHLQTKGVGCEIYYPVPLHLRKCFLSLGYRQGDCPEAETASASVLSIPIYPELSSEQQGHVADRILEFLS